MTEESTIIQHRLPSEGADYLLLAGVNDAHLQELARQTGCRVILRGDYLILSGELGDVERAIPVAQKLIDMARLQTPFGVDDVRRLAATAGTEAERLPTEEEAGGGGAPGPQLRRDDLRILLPGLRKVIQPRSEGQAAYLEAIAKNDIVISIGPAGTGKTYLAVAMAVDALLKNRVKRIILARPAVEAGESLGFLPGDLQEKVDPYLRPLYDALEDMLPQDRVRRYIESRTIEIAPLAYMRGRTLSDAFVILDEAQNATRAQMKMFLTRLGLNSRTVITGDKTQIDLVRRSESGLLEIEAILKGVDGINFTYLEAADVVRHRLVKDIIDAYAAAGGEGESEAE
ncbi:MAG: AAA family ATPase [Gemmatimonadetes bacterium]|nr:PhoH family protein [Gemmatimonadota bacterium]NIQ58630.1 PhoH family protein [Gemmatimonadota bacterium]NIU78821.1 AAA family ATPase [Gammaproteobacteria bacterium]NIX47628.1 AAA family ATPase [Gemmatimonadota bacterium]NIY11990.1 AAA family ATPase [Gemmatimonadota bacterium]